jgi:hypothetical protein
MTRFFSHYMGFSAGLALVSFGGAALAASDPAVTEPEPSVVEAAEPASPEPALAPAPVVAPLPEPAPAPLAPLAEPTPQRDEYDGPPLLLGRGGKKVKIGAYGAMGGAYTRFMGRDSGLVSLEGALLLDHRFSIGLVGYAFTRTPRGPNDFDGTRQEFGAGYGGIAVRYSLLSKLPVYPTFGLVAGGGAVNLHHKYDWDDDADWGIHHDDDEWDNGSYDPFLFVQPELALNANATRWLRFGATVGYRFTGGVGRFGLNESDLNGVTAGANVSLGWF